MKKLISILITLFTMVSIFAFNDATSVRATVIKKYRITEPVFSLFSLDGIGAVATVDGLKDVTELLTTDLDISTAEVEIEFRLHQKEDTLYNGLVTVQVITTPFKGLYNNRILPQPTIDDINLLYNSKGVSVEYTETLNLFSFNYSGIEIVKSGDLGSFTVTWPCSEDAPAGEYEASVSLVYSVQ